MSTETPLGVGVTSLPARVPPTRFGRTRLVAYLRLAKLGMIDYYLSIVVVWSLLPAAERLPGRGAWATMVTFLLGEVFLVGAAVAFDDVAGYRDGSDAVNYGADAPVRRLRRKPLLAGSLTDTAAIRSAWGMIGAGALCWGATLVVAPHRPTWAVLCVVAAGLVIPQYSWGLRIGYNGFQEVFLAAVGWAFVLPLCGLLTGAAGGPVVVQTFLFGLGPLLFGVYSNINDIVGDRSVGRPTVACLASPRVNAVFIGGLSCLETVVIVAAALTGIAAWWFPLILLPVTAARTAQFVVGIVRGDVLRARLIGIRAHRILVAGLVVANLLGAGRA